MGKEAGWLLVENSLFRSISTGSFQPIRRPWWWIGSNSFKTDGVVHKQCISHPAWNRLVIDKGGAGSAPQSVCTITHRTWSVLTKHFKVLYRILKGQFEKEEEKKNEQSKDWLYKIFFTTLIWGFPRIIFGYGKTPYCWWKCMHNGCEKKSKTIFWNLILLWSLILGALMCIYCAIPAESCVIIYFLQLRLISVQYF